jgi:hypothetical protein
MSDKPPRIPRCPRCHDYPAGTGHTAEDCCRLLYKKWRQERRWRWRAQVRLQMREEADRLKEVA